MPYADNRGVRIHYRTEGDGMPLVLQHGFTQSGKDWDDAGFVAGLKRDFRLILVDARGHGGSDKPHDPAAYALEARAGDVVCVLDGLGIDKAHFWGYSMGGWIGFGMAEFASERLDRLVIGGQHPYHRSMEATRLMVRTGIAEGKDAFVAAAEKTWGFVATPEMRADLCNNDLEALLAAAQDRPGLEHLLPRMRMPCCLYAGEADPVCEQASVASRSIPNARFFSLPGLSHAGTFEASGVVLPRVAAFLRGAAETTEYDRR